MTFSRDSAIYASIMALAALKVIFDVIPFMLQKYKKIFK